MQQNRSSSTLVESIKWFNFFDNKTCLYIQQRLSPAMKTDVWTHEAAIIQNNGVTRSGAKILIFTTVMVSPSNEQIILLNRPARNEQSKIWMEERKGSLPPS